MPGVRRWLPAAALAAGVVALDQWTKALIVRDLGPASEVHVVPLVGDWLALEYAENRGAAFGLLGGQPLVVAAVALAVLAMVIVHAVRSGRNSTVLLLGTGLTVGGAIGNLIDRLRLGFVVDFVAIGAWPNFNVADTAICAGVALIALDALLAAPPTAPDTRRDLEHAHD